MARSHQYLAGVSPVPGGVSLVCGVSPVPGGGLTSMWGLTSTWQGSHQYLAGSHQYMAGSHQYLAGSH